MTSVKDRLPMPTSDPSHVASEIERLLEALNRADLGSEAALDLIGQAVTKITYFARDHIDQALPEIGEVTDDKSLKFQRQAAAALRPLLMSYGFYGHLADELLRGFWSLEIGVTPPALKATPRPGSRFSIQIRELSLRMVVLAEFIKRTVGKKAAYEEMLRACGVNLSSVNGHKEHLGLFSTSNLEDPYRAEDVLLVSSGQPSLTPEQKLELASTEIRGIKLAIDEHLKTAAGRNLA